MKKFFTGIIIVLLGIYAAFFVCVYAFGNLNKYLPTVQKLAQETVGLNIDAKSLNLKPTFKMELEFFADDLKVTYPNKKEILFVDDFSLKIPLLPVVIGDIKVSEIKVNSVKANFSLSKIGEIDLITYLTPYLEKMNNQDTQAAQNTALPKYFKISTKMPDLKINKYNISIFDEKINQDISVKGDKLDIQKFDIEKGIKLSSKGEISTLKQKFADYDVTVETFFPKSADNKKNEAQMLYIDPFEHMIKYGFYSDIFADLKISENKDDIVNIKGDLNIKKLNLRTNVTNTNGTFIDLKFDKNSVNLDSDLYLSKEQKADIVADIKYGRHSEINANVKSDKLELANLLDLTKAVFNILGIDTNLSTLSVNGYVKPDFTIKSDMKTLKSKGHIYIKDANISHKIYPARITDINSNINLDNNKIAISDTKALINNQPISVQGNITQNADCDIKINSRSLPIASLFEILADKNMKNSYKVQSGTLDADIYVKGKLDKLQPKALVSTSNLSLTDKINHLIISAPKVSLNINSDLKNFKGQINSDLIKIYLSDYKLTALAKKIKIDFDDKDLTMSPFVTQIQNSIINVDATVKDYMKKLDINANIKGNMQTSVVKSFIPKEYWSMFVNKGSLPVNGKITSNGADFSFKGQVNADANNYITPVHINQLLNKPTTTEIDISTKGNELIIDNISLGSASSKFADIKGQISSYYSNNPKFKNLKINLPNSFTFAIPSMPNSSITLNSKLTVAGSMNSPKILGNANVSQVAIPSFQLTGKNIVVNIDDSTIKASSDYLNFAGSTFAFNLKAVNDFSKTFVVNNLNVTSNTTDLGKIMEVTSQIPQNSYAPGVSVPLKIMNGHGTIKTFKMDAITAQNASADFNFLNNALNLKNLTASAYGGSVSGTIGYDMKYLRLTAKLSGQHINPNAVVAGLLGLSDQIRGNLSFNSDITMAGSTQRQQMQTLRGKINFIMLNGHMGTLGNFEYFLHAQNLLSKGIIKTSLNSIISNIAPKDTGEFDKMTGSLSFTNGWANVEKITTSGKNMSLYMTGKFNMLNNNAKVDIYGKISQDVANSLGKIGELSIEKLTTDKPKLGMTLDSILKSYNYFTSQDIINQIPKLASGNDSGAKCFKVQIDGNVQSVTALKSFMWIMSEQEFKTKLKEYSESSDTTSNVIQSAIKVTQDAVNSTKSERVNTIKESIKTELKDNVLPGFLDNIGTKK